MEIVTFQVGALGCNCYLLFQEGGTAVVIDPGADSRRILTELESRKLKLEGIWLTHGHADHIGAAEELRKKTGTQISVHSEDKEMMEDPNHNLSSFLEGEEYAIRPDLLLRGGELLEIAGEELQVIHTPGHTFGGVCYFFQKEGILFSGDTLFAGSIGRTDLPGGDGQKLRASLENLFSILPPSTRVFPGHGGPTVLQREYSVLSLLE